MPSYRIAKRAPVTRAVRVRLHPSLPFETLTYQGEGRDDAVRAFAVSRARSLLGTVPRTLFLTTWTVRGSPVQRGGPGLAVELLGEQLARDAEVVEEGRA